MLIKNLETPAMVLDLDLFERNITILKDMAESANVSFRPHYKSFKSTALAHRLIEAGAKGITCAKVAEAEDLVLSGIEDVLIANQITKPSRIARAAYLAGCCRLTVCVDNAKNIWMLQQAAAAQETVFYCLVEYEIGMNRCGVDTKEAVLALAEEIGRCDNLRFEGIQAYAGHLSHEKDYNIRKEKSEEVERCLSELKQFLESHGVSVKEVSGASTGTVEFRSRGTVYTEVQAGSYLLMDAAYEKLRLPFAPALFVLGSVVSISGDRVVTDAGIKTISADQTAPVLRRNPEVTIGLSEEHGSFVLAAHTLSIGDVVSVIPGHCCTTVNLHDYYYLARGDRIVDRIPVTSRGKSQ